jgi:glyoxylate reductase
MKILYHDIKRDSRLEKELGVVYADKEALLRQSDFISLHLPLSAETYRCIGENELKMMKPSAILVNSSRGQVVDQTALLTALENGQIAGAGLDVADPEPVRANDPLLGLPQVTVLPHIGSATRETRTKMAELAAQNLILALNGKPMISCINPEAYGEGRSAQLF